MSHQADYFLELAARRHSTRSYRPDPVPEEKIERCLEAARLAPSACNSQPWHFIVITSSQQRARVAAAAFSGVHAIFKFAGTAPVLIALLSRRSSYAAALAGRLRNVRYNLIDLGIAGEHLVLQAAAEGLGTCWIGWFNERGVRRALALSRGTRVELLISMGYPATGQVPPKTRKPLDEIREYR